jgi:hypothetical protein
LLTGQPFFQRTNLFLEIVLPNNITLHPPLQSPHFGQLANHEAARSQHLPSTPESHQEVTAVIPAGWVSWSKK